jgi:predicted ester cyclase
MTTEAARSTLEANKATVRRLYEEIINAARVELVDELMGVEYLGPNGERGPAGFAATVQDLRRGFPDIAFTVEDLMAEGDRVAVRWRWSATHSGQFRTFAATNRHVTNTGIAIYEFRDGRVMRAWLETDRLGALQQIGAIG